MGSVALAQVGCGGMGLRHVYGLIEAKAHGLAPVDLVALCDMNESAAQYVAREAERGLGRRPRVYTDFDTMLARETALDAVNIVTDTRMHHVFALKAFQMGKHVAVEKPMGLTVRACRRMVEGARAARRVLSVSENFRRDPVMRLAKSVLDSGVVGMPRLLLDVAITGSRSVQQVAVWRHLKLRGGWVLEHGVHNADLTLYFMGAVERILAETQLWETVRFIESHREDERAREISRFYGHRVKEPIEEGDSFKPTAEDMALALLRFHSGALGQMSFSIASPGQDLQTNVIYGSEGSLELPRNRTGRPVRVQLLGRAGPMPEEELLAHADGFEIDDVTARLFGGEKRLTSYSLSFEEVDRKLIAIELEDFARAVLDDREPEVSGEAGLAAVALTYGILESGHLHRPVDVGMVVDGTVEAYQQEINQSIGL